MGSMTVNNSGLYWVTSLEGAMLPAHQRPF